MSMTMATLAELTVCDITAAVARGELMPDELLEATLARIDALEPKVQAFTLLDVAGAREQAGILTAEVKGGKLRGPLHGVPVAIKDEFHVKGMPTAMRGLDNPPLEPEDATCVARLRAAGAIIVGKTTMPIGGVMPPTRNPWNLEHTAGGTSSGSGAAVGARMVPFAIGEQTAGSNLRPAAYNGVAGLKPTYGRISRFGCYPFTWSRDHVGLIGLTMADLALVLSVIGGPDERDPTTIQEAPPPADLEMDAFEPPRIGVVRNFYPERTEPEMQTAIESAAARFGDAGAAVIDFMLPEQFGLSWHGANLVGAEGAVFNLGQRMLQGTSDDSPPQQRAAELVPATYYVQARRIRTWLTGMIKEAMAGVDALLMPVAPGAAPKGLASTGDASLLVPWSFLGFPAITVNGGLSPNGLPLGLQFVAPPRADWDLMRVGAWTETTLGRLPPPVVPSM